jgi:hypothetical protein
MKLIMKKQRKPKKQHKLINHIEHCKYMIYSIKKHKRLVKSYYFRKQIELTKKKLSIFLKK